MLRAVFCSLDIRFDWRGNSVLTIHNFDGSPHEVFVDPGVEGGEQLSDLMLPMESYADDDGRHRIALDALEYGWYRVGGLDYAVHQTQEG